MHGKDAILIFFIRNANKVLERRYSNISIRDVNNAWERCYSNILINDANNV